MSSTSLLFCSSLERLTPSFITTTIFKHVLLISVAIIIIMMIPSKSPLSTTTRMTWPIFVSAAAVTRSCASANPATLSTVPGDHVELDLSGGCAFTINAGSNIGALVVTGTTSASKLFVNGLTCTSNARNCITFDTPSSMIIGEIVIRDVVMATPTNNIVGLQPGGLSYRAVIDFKQPINQVLTKIVIEGITTTNSFGFTRGSPATDLILYIVRFGGTVQSTTAITISSLNIDVSLIGQYSAANKLAFYAISFNDITSCTGLVLSISRITIIDFPVVLQTTLNTFLYVIYFGGSNQIADINSISIAGVTVDGLDATSTAASGVRGVNFYGVYFASLLSGFQSRLSIEAVTFKNVAVKSAGPVALYGVFFNGIVSAMPKVSIKKITVSNASSQVTSTQSSATFILLHHQVNINNFGAGFYEVDGIAVSDFRVSGATDVLSLAVNIGGSISAINQLQISDVSHTRCKFTSDLNSVTVHAVRFQNTIDSISSNITLSNMKFENSTFIAQTSLTHYIAQFQKSVKGMPNFIAEKFITNNIIYSSASNSVEFTGIEMDSVQGIGKPSAIYTSGMTIRDFSLFYNNSFAFARQALTITAIAFENAYSAGEPLDGNFINIQNVVVGREGFKDQIQNGPSLTFANAFGFLTQLSASNKYLPDLGSSFDGSEVSYKNEVVSFASTAAIHILKSSRVLKYLKAWLLIENCTIAHMSLKSFSGLATAYPIRFSEAIGLFDGGFYASRIHVYDLIINSNSYSEVNTFIFDKTIADFGSASDAVRPLTYESPIVNDQAFQIVFCRTDRINMIGKDTARVWTINFVNQSTPGPLTNFTSILIKGNTITSVSANATGGWAGVLIYANVRPVIGPGAFAFTDNSAELSYSNASLSASYVAYTGSFKNLDGGLTITNNELRLRQVRQDTGTGPTSAAGFSTWQNAAGIENVLFLTATGNSLVMFEAIRSKTQFAAIVIYVVEAITTVTGTATFSDNQIAMPNGGSIVQETTALDMPVVSLRDIIGAGNLFMNNNSIRLGNGARVVGRQHTRIYCVLIYGQVTNIIGDVRIVANEIRTSGAGGSIEQTDSSNWAILHVANFLMLHINPLVKYLSDIQNLIVERNVIHLSGAFLIRAVNTATDSAVIFNFYQALMVKNVLGYIRMNNNIISGGGVGDRATLRSADTNINVSCIGFFNNVQNFKDFEVKNNRIAFLEVISTNKAVSVQPAVFGKGLYNPAFRSDSSFLMSNTTIESIESKAELVVHVESLSFIGGFDYTIKNFVSFTVNDTRVNDITTQSTPSGSFNISRAEWHIFHLNVKIDSVSSLVFNNTDLSNIGFLYPSSVSFAMLFFGPTIAAVSTTHLTNTSLIQVTNAVVNFLSFSQNSIADPGEAMVRFVHFQVPVEISDKGTTQIVISNLVGSIEAVTLSGGGLNIRVVDFEQGILLPSSPSLPSAVFKSSLSVTRCSFTVNDGLTPVNNLRVFMVAILQGLNGLRGGSLIVDDLNFTALNTISPSQGVFLSTVAITSSASSSLTPENEMTLVSVKNCLIQVKKGATGARSHINIHHLFTNNFGLINIKKVIMSTNKIDLSESVEISQSAIAPPSMNILISSLYADVGIINISDQLTLDNTQILLPSGNLIAMQDLIVNFLNTNDIKNISGSGITFHNNKIALSGVKMKATNRRVRVYGLLANGVSNVSSISITNQEIGPQVPGSSGTLVEIQAHAASDANVTFIRVRDIMTDVRTFLMDNCAISSLEVALGSSSAVTIASFSSVVSRLQSFVIKNSLIENVGISVVNNPLLSTVEFTNELRDISDNVSIINCRMEQLQNVTSIDFVGRVIHTDLSNAKVTNVNRFLIHGATIIQSTTTKRGPSFNQVSFTSKNETYVSILRAVKGIETVDTFEVSDAVFSGHMHVTDTQGIPDIQAKMVHIDGMQFVRNLSVTNVSALGITFSKSTTLLDNGIWASIVWLQQTESIDYIFLSDLTLDYQGHAGGNPTHELRSTIFAVNHVQSSSLFCKNYTIGNVRVYAANAPASNSVIAGVILAGYVKFIDDLTIRNVDVDVRNIFISSNGFSALSTQVNANNINNLSITFQSLTLNNITASDNATASLATFGNVFISPVAAHNITNSINFARFIIDIQSSLDFQNMNLLLINLLINTPSDSNAHDNFFYVTQPEGLIISNATFNIAPSSRITASRADLIIINGVRIVPGIDGCSNPLRSPFATILCRKSDSIFSASSKPISVSDIKMTSVNFSNPLLESTATTILANSVINISLIQIDGPFQNIENVVQTLAFTNIHLNGTASEDGNGLIKLETGSSVGSVHVHAVNFLSPVTNISAQYIFGSPSTTAVFLFDSISMRNFSISQRTEPDDVIRGTELTLILFRRDVASSPSSPTPLEAPITYRAITVSNLVIDSVTVLRSSTIALHIVRFGESLSSIYSFLMTRVRITNTHLLRTYRTFDFSVCAVNGDVIGADYSPLATYLAPPRPMLFFAFNMITVNVTIQRSPLFYTIKTGAILKVDGNLENIGVISPIPGKLHGVTVTNAEVKFWSHADDGSYLVTDSGKLASDDVALVVAEGSVFNCTRILVGSSSLLIGSDYVSTPILVDSLKINVQTRLVGIAQFFTLDQTRSLIVTDSQLHTSSILQAGLVVTSFIVLVTQALRNLDTTLSVSSSSINTKFETYEPNSDSSFPSAIIAVITTMSDVSGDSDFSSNAITFQSASCLRPFTSAVLHSVEGCQDISGDLRFFNNSITVAPAGITTSSTIPSNMFDGNYDVPFNLANIGMSTVRIVSGPLFDGVALNIANLTVSDSSVIVSGDVSASDSVGLHAVCQSNGNIGMSNIGVLNVLRNKINVTRPSSSSSNLVVATFHNIADIFIAISSFAAAPQNVGSILYEENVVELNEGAALRSQNSIFIAITRVPQSPQISSDSNSIITYRSFNKIVSTNTTVITSVSSLLRICIHDVRDLAVQVADPQNTRAPPLSIQQSEISGAFHFAKSESVGEVQLTSRYEIDTSIASAPISYPNKTEISQSKIELIISASPAISSRKLSVATAILQTAFLSYDENMTLPEYVADHPSELLPSNPSLDLSSNTITLACRYLWMGEPQIVDDFIVKHSVMRVESGSQIHRGVARALFKQNRIRTVGDSLLVVPAAPIILSSLSSAILRFNSDFTKTTTLFWDFFENSIEQSTAEIHANSSSSSVISTGATHVESFADPGNDYRVKFLMVDNDLPPLPSSKIASFFEYDIVTMLDFEIGCNRWMKIVDRTFLNEHGKFPAMVRVHNMNFTCAPTKTKTVSETLIVPTTTTTSTSDSTTGLNPIVINTTSTSPPTTTNNSTTSAVTSSTVAITTATNSTATSSTNIITSTNLSTTMTITTSPTTTSHQATTTTSVAAATTNRTRTKTVSIILQTPSPTSEPVKISPESSGITSTAVVLGTIAANPAVGPLMVRNGLILLGGSCGESLGELDFATSPFGLVIGDDEYRWWNGAVVGNFALLVASFPLLLGLSGVYAIFVKKKLWNDYLTGVRAICGTFWVVLSGPMIVGFVASYSYSKEGAETFGILILGIVTCGMTIVWPLHIIRRVHKEMEMGEDEEGTSRIATEGEKKASILTRIKAYWFDSKNGREWMPLLHELRIGWSFLFEYSESLAYLVVELVFGFGINVTLALMQDSGASKNACKLRSLLNLILHIPPTTFLIFKNPLFSRFDMLITTAMWIGNTFTSVMLVMKIFDVGLPINETLYAFGLVLAILNLFASLGLVLNMWQILRMLSQRKKLGDDFDVIADHKMNKKKKRQKQQTVVKEQQQAPIDVNLDSLEEPMILSSMDEELEEFFNSNNNSSSNSNSNNNNDDESSHRSGSNGDGTNKKTKNKNNSLINIVENEDDTDIDLAGLLEDDESNEQKNIVVNDDDDVDDEALDLERVLGTFKEEFPELEAALNGK